MTDEEIEEKSRQEAKIHCKNKIIVELANKLDRGGGHYVSVNIKDNKFGICAECHKFSLIGRKNKLCSACYYQGLEQATCDNWELNE